MDPRFEPPPIERLDLGKLLERPRAEPLSPPPPVQRTSLLPVVVVVLIAAAGIGGWQWYATRRATPSDEAAAAAPAPASVVGGASEAAAGDGEPVLLMISTTPKDAAIFVDGQRAAVNPVSLPRSARPVQVRVEADGWEPRELAIEVDRSRRVEVALRRARR